MLSWLRTFILLNWLIGNILSFSDVMDFGGLVWHWVLLILFFYHSCFCCHFLIFFSLSFLISLKKNQVFGPSDAVDFVQKLLKVGAQWNLVGYFEATLTFLFFLQSIFLAFFHALINIRLSCCVDKFYLLLLVVFIYFTLSNFITLMRKNEL